MNLIYTNSIIPNQLKIALIIPKFKTGSRNSINNYRPIANINILAKIMEKNMLNRISFFIRSNNLLHPNQYAYQKHMSIIDTLIEKTNFIYSSFNKSKATLAINLDLSRAFETVCHSLLFTKLLNIGFSSNALLLLQNYLNNRYQMTIVNKIISEPYLIKTGLPQGTILAPWLFILFINDLFNIQICGHTLCYADDTVILFELNQKIITIDHTTEDSILKIKDWFNENLLIINGKKSNYTIYNLHTIEKIDTQITFGNKNLFHCNNPKYLGLFFDLKLHWKVHINKMLIKTKFMIKQAHYLSKILNIKNKFAWYFAFVFSYISQLALIISTCNKNQSTKLNNSHCKIIKALFKQNIKKTTKIITTNHPNSTTIHNKFIYISEKNLNEFMINNNLLNFMQVANYNIIISIHKIKINYYKSNNNNLNDIYNNLPIANLNTLANIKFNTVTNLTSYNTRSMQNKLLVPYYTKTVGQKNFDYRAAILYNNLPIDITCISNLKTFKLKLKHYLLHS